MDLRSRLGLVGHEVATRKWISRPGWMGDMRFGVATKVLRSRQGRSVGETEAGRDLV